jgi:hypothetical protein
VLGAGVGEIATLPAAHAPEKIQKSKNKYLNNMVNIKKKDPKKKQSVAKIADREHRALH